MTSRSYLGKMNSTIGSVVPLAMFLIRLKPAYDRQGLDLVVRPDDNFNSVQTTTV